MRNGDKCSLYFHPRKFIENNIKYRISSGASIASYKQSQVFLLTELSFNAFHNFSSVAKEILLLKYDVWFDFLCEVEQFLLVSDEETVCDWSIDKILEMSQERVEYYDKTMGDNPKTFDAKYVKIWNEIHSMSYSLLVKYIKDLSGLSDSSFFSGLTARLVSTMNHTLYELHECDVLLFEKGDLEFNLDSVCCEYNDAFGENLIIKKLDIFSKIRTTNSILIKQYSDVQMPFSQTPLKKSLEKRKINYKVV